VGVGEAKTSCNHASGFGYVGEVFTLGDVDGDFTAFGAMFFILTTFILWALLDTESLHGGIQKLGKSFGVAAVAADPNSFCHSRECGRDRWWWFAGGKLMGAVAFALVEEKVGSGILQSEWDGAGKQRGSFSYKVTR
jgi:hypothetical protein